MIVIRKQIFFLYSATYLKRRPWPNECWLTWSKLTDFIQVLVDINWPSEVFVELLIDFFIDATWLSIRVMYCCWIFSTLSSSAFDFLSASFSRSMFCCLFSRSIALEVVASYVWVRSSSASSTIRNFMSNIRRFSLSAISRMRNSLRRNGHKVEIGEWVKWVMWEFCWQFMQIGGVLYIWGVFYVY